jgi:hypothetical protein
LRSWQLLRSLGVERNDGRVECDRVGRFEHYRRLQLRRLQLRRLQLRRLQRLRQLQWLRVR